MGLDMYLTAKEYINESDRDEVDPYTDEIPVAGRTYEVGYWRKANAIHRWFVDNVAGGVDDCRPVEVEQSDLESLLYIVREVMADPDKAEGKLPTSPGFFFGSTEYDDDYLDDLKHTEMVLTKAIKLQQLGGWNVSFQYQASW